MIYFYFHLLYVLIMKKQFKSACKAIFCGITIISVFFFITEFEAHRPKPPQFIGSTAEPFAQEGVFIQAKAYSARESQTYLSRDLIERGFQPVQVTIQNNTARSYYLSNQWVDLPNATPHTVASYVSRSAIPRSIAFKVAGFLFWPFLIPATIDGILTIKSHLKMRGDYHAKSIKDTEEPLIPYSTVHRILFVPKEKYSDEFTLHLKDQKSGQFTPFHIKINV